jgi:hypothetical protein
VLSSCEIAFSGQAFTHLASWHARHDSAKLNIGVMRTTRILDRNGLCSFFSWLQANSQIPQPVHLLGSTETNFLWGFFTACILLTKPFKLKYLLLQLLLTIAYEKCFFDGKNAMQRTLFGVYFFNRGCLCMEYSIFGKFSIAQTSKYCFFFHLSFLLPGIRENLGLNLGSFLKNN